MICAIHQPNFFPWLGYFEKIWRADVFIFLNQVDYEKSGHSMQCYTNRVAILGSNGQKKYIYCPVVREHGPQRIDTVIMRDQSWKQDILSELNKSYGEAPFKKQIDEWVHEIVDYDTEYLSVFNINAITLLCEKLGIITSLFRQDEYNTKKHSTDLLVELTKEVKCDKYLYGRGGSNYQDPELFRREKIDAIAQDYISSEYYQGDGNHPFIPGLSILDALYWIGPDETLKVLKRDRVNI